MRRFSSGSFPLCYWAIFQPRIARSANEAPWVKGIRFALGPSAVPLPSAPASPIRATTASRAGSMPQIHGDPMVSVGLASKPNRTQARAFQLSDWSWNQKATANATAFWFTHAISLWDLAVVCVPAGRGCYRGIHLNQGSAQHPCALTRREARSQQSVIDLSRDRKAVERPGR